MKNLIISTIVISLFISFQSYSQCNVIPITTNIDGFQITGDYRVYPGNAGACNQIVSPIIIVEGFDPFDNTTNEGNNIFQNADQSNLLFDLRQQGFDIITTT
ncbi:hypothetical protein [Marivirga sp.]|uniref:hypothetical protein n=1 Tax=Marivirga sp. TaxID=2018662 RepID=UPI0025EBE364|nr:hypothetical protein [Marivirga sp.]